MISVFSFFPASDRSSSCKSGCAYAWKKRNISHCNHAVASESRASTTIANMSCLLQLYIPTLTKIKRMREVRRCTYLECTKNVLNNNITQTSIKEASVLDDHPSAVYITQHRSTLTYPEPATSILTRTTFSYICVRKS